MWCSDLTAECSCVFPQHSVMGMQAHVNLLSPITEVIHIKYRFNPLFLCTLECEQFSFSSLLKSISITPVNLSAVVLKLIKCLKVFYLEETDVKKKIKQKEKKTFRSSKSISTLTACI